MNMIKNYNLTSHDNCLSAQEKEKHCHTHENEHLRDLDKMIQKTNLYMVKDEQV